MAVVLLGNDPASLAFMVLPIKAYKEMGQMPIQDDAAAHHGELLTRITGSRTRRNVDSLINSLILSLAGSNELGIGISRR